MLGWETCRSRRRRRRARGKAFMCQGKEMVSLAFITPQTSEEAAVVDDDDNSNTTQPASYEMWVKKLCK